MPLLCFDLAVSGGKPNYRTLRQQRAEGWGTRQRRYSEMNP